MTTNDHAAALELWEAMGEAGIDRGNIRLHKSTLGYPDRMKILSSDGFEISSLEPEEYVFILTGHAERWLGQQLSNSMMSEENPTRARVTEWVERMYKGSLPAAIRAEIGRGK